MLAFTNTLAGKKEKFTPIHKNKVGMYNCGPTVYDYAHIGNLRSYVFADILRRTLELNNLEVTQVINITDIGHLSSDQDEGEDKMTKGLRREGKPITLEAMKELADFYTEKFKLDLERLNIKSPHHLPKASEHLGEEIELIKKLDEKGFVYSIANDGLYFDTSKDPHYGKLKGISTDDSQARIQDNSKKRNFRDFALWKYNPTLGLESPWGKGFPGWHIECSAMSMKYLGETFDIHTGGIDHIPVHHNNEIAQSENATGKPYVHYWIHHAFVNIENGKMAKSEGTVLTLNSLIEKNIDPLVYRYWLLTAHYKTQVNFTWETLQATENAYNKLKEHLESFGTEKGKVHLDYSKRFQEFINDDLDTPRAIALMWELIKDGKISTQDKKSTLLEFDKVLGLGLDKILKLEVPAEIQNLVNEREKARENKNWKGSDTIRLQVENLGFEINDTDKGPKITKKS